MSNENQGREDRNSTTQPLSELMDGGWKETARLYAINTKHHQEKREEAEGRLLGIAERVAYAKIAMSHEDALFIEVLDQIAGLCRINEGGE